LGNGINKIVFKDVVSVEQNVKEKEAVFQHVGNHSGQLDLNFKLLLILIFSFIEFLEVLFNFFFSNPFVKLFNLTLILLYEF